MSQAAELIYPHGERMVMRDDDGTSFTSLQVTGNGKVSADDRRRQKK